MTHCKYVAVLETIWGSEVSPRFFRINPYNVSGSRLYRLIESRDLWVTNVCRLAGRHARQHGIPDADWLCQNLNLIDCDVLLVCGRIAQATYAQTTGYWKRDARVIRMPHPAARNWTREQFEHYAKLIRNQFDGKRSSNYKSLDGNSRR